MTDNKRIMVVEDESLLLEAISAKLKLNNFIVMPFTSGREAIEALRMTSDLPSAIWLDYHLKDMDGIEFMNSLKQIKPAADLPVLVVSNSATPDKVHSMLAMGAKKYVLKAENRLEDIIGTLDEFLLEPDNQNTAGNN